MRKICSLVCVLAFAGLSMAQTTTPVCTHHTGVGANFRFHNNFGFNRFFNPLLFQQPIVVAQPSFIPNFGYNAGLGCGVGSSFVPNFNAFAGTGCCGTTQLVPQVAVGGCGAGLVPSVAGNFGYSAGLGFNAGIGTGCGAGIGAAFNPFFANRFNRFGFNRFGGGLLSNGILGGGVLPLVTDIIGGVLGGGFRNNIFNRGRFINARRR